MDFVFELSNHVRFESVKGRSITVQIEGVSFRVSDLQDVIDAKRAANQPEDLAVLQLLEDFLRIRQAMTDADTDDDRRSLLML